MNFFDKNEEDNKDNENNKEEEKKPLDINIIRATLAKNDYVYLRPIGKGGFASVFLIFSNQYNLNFVVKVSDYKGSRKNASQEFDLTEINSLISLNHPNIINMYKYFTDECYLYIVLEYCEGGSLDDLLKQNGPVRPPTLYNYCYQILTALKHCHDLQISHSDIKPANILIDKNKRLKLADFGLSKGFSLKMLSNETMNQNFVNKNGQILTKNFAGSKPYMSPELIQLTAYDPFKADIWSLGVTFYQLATGRLPWNTYDMKEMLMSITMGVFTFQNSQVPPAFCNIIHRMLEVKPSKRATLEWLLEQSIFNSSSIAIDKNQSVSRSPSLGSQTGSFATNINSFKLGSRPSGRVKLSQRSRNNSSVNVMERNSSFSNFSSETGDELTADNLTLHDIPKLSGFNSNVNFQNPNASQQANMNLLNPNLLNRNTSMSEFKNSSNSLFSSRALSDCSFGAPNLQNLRLDSNLTNQNSSNADLLKSSQPGLNIPNSNKVNFSGRHLLYSTSSRTPCIQTGNNFVIENYKNTRLINCCNNLCKNNSSDVQSEQNDVDLSPSGKPKFHKGADSAPKTFA